MVTGINTMESGLTIQGSRNDLRIDSAQYGSSGQAFVEGSVGTLLTKLETARAAMANERGPFLLFGLFRRADLPERWDLVVAAPWLEPSTLESFEYIAKKLASAGLSADEMVSISRIAVVSSGIEVQSLINLLQNRPRPAQLNNFSFGGVPILEAIIFDWNDLKILPLPRIVRKQRPQVYPKE